MSNWDGYTKMSLDAPGSIVWASTGAEGSGKSAFALGAPEPIWIAAFDTHGMNRVGRQFKVREDGELKDIRVKRYGFDPRPHKTPKALSEHATIVWEEFIADYTIATRNARTIIIDREDLSYEVIRYKVLGALQAAAKEYGPINIEMTSLLQEAYTAGVNLGILRGVKDEWESQFDPAKGKKVPISTGRKVAAGWKEAKDIADITLWHFWDDKEKTFQTRIDKFTEKDVRGQEIPDLTWIQMAMAAFPETDESSWV